MIEDDMQVQHPEVPIIYIEHSDEAEDRVQLPPLPQTRRHNWQQWLAMGAGIALVMTLLMAAYQLVNYYFFIGVPISHSPAENIAKLQQPVEKATPGVVATSDTVLGVPLNFYALEGLQASIEMREPGLKDKSVYMFCRCADYTADGKYLGSLVVGGEEKQDDRSRLGYMAMADGQMVIGVSRSDKVKDYVQEHGGSFFRQFVLVSDGELPPRFFLHGKVERRAIGRKDDTLYFIVSAQKETLWGFADALREYGFTDAIYITGGGDYFYYRSSDGRRHDVGNPNQYPHIRWATDIPWLVFRKAKYKGKMSK